MITIKDLAAHLGLSPSTISKALSNHPKVSQRTKERVAQAVQEFHYTPNLQARSLATQTTHTIGLMIQDIGDGFFSHSAYGVEEVMIKEGYQIAYHSIRRDPQRVLQFLTTAREYRYSGVFITPDVWSQELLKRLKQMDLPVVSLRRKSPPEAEHVPFVDSDHSGGAKLAVHELTRAGHCCIGMISSDHQNDQEKISGYHAGMKKRGLTPHLQKIDVSAYDDRFKAGYAAIKVLLAREPKMSAVIVTEEKTAIGAYQYLQEQGRQVPTDFSMISFDDRGISSLYCFRLSTIQQNLMELGRQAAKMMLRMIENPLEVPQSITLETSICKRNSIATYSQKAVVIKK